MQISSFLTPNPKIRLFFDKIILLHELTYAWLNEHELSNFSLDRGIRHRIDKKIWDFKSLQNVAFEDLLDHFTHEKEIWSAYEMIELLQVWTFHEFFYTQPSILGYLLEISWRYGKRVSEQKPFIRTLAELLEVLQETPFFGFLLEQKSCLLKRSTLHEMSIFRKKCPHKYTNIKDSLLAHHLCELQTAWIKGFCYGLNPCIHLTHVQETPSSLCLYTWKYIH